MRELDGETNGLKALQIKRLESTYRRKVKGDSLVTVPLARHLTEISHELGRQVGVLIDRSGHIQRVIIGGPSRLYLPDVGRARVGVGRLRGLRLIRTELRAQGLTNEDLADLSKLRLDAVASIQVDRYGTPKEVHWAHLHVLHEKGVHAKSQPRKTITPQDYVAKSLQDLPDDALQIIRVKF